MHVYKDFPLSEILYYKIGGKAKFVLQIQNKEDLLAALDFVRKEKVERLLPVGLGSNLLVSDEQFKGAVLWFCKAKYRPVLGKAESSSIVLREESSIEVFASVLLDDVIQFSFQNKLVGLEWAGGLPSTVGGAIRGNAGAFGSEIKDSAYEAEVLDLSNNNHLIKTFSNVDLKFSYRNSLIKQNRDLIVARGVFKLTQATESQIGEAKELYRLHIEHRQKNNPLDYPSCGSVFQNIREREKVATILSKWPDIEDLVRDKWHGKVAMGYVIKRLGFSGFQIGGAEVSEKHANYILNKNNARFTDVIMIIEKIKEKFYQEFNFYPELEVEVVI